jgi:hypothetical protein
MHAPLHSLSYLRTIEEALADLVHKHSSTPPTSRCKLTRMIKRLRFEIAHRDAKRFYNYAGMAAKSSLA